LGPTNSPSRRPTRAIKIPHQGGFLLAVIWLVDGAPEGSPRHSSSTQPEAAIVELAQKTQIFLIVASLSDWFTYEAWAYAGHSVPIEPLGDRPAGRWSKLEAVIQGR